MGKEEYPICTDCRIKPTPHKSGICDTCRLIRCKKCGNFFHNRTNEPKTVCKSCSGLTDIEEHMIRGSRGVRDVLRDYDSDDSHVVSLGRDL